MFKFSDQIKAEFDRINALQERIRDHDKLLADQTLICKARCNGEYAVFSERSRTVNGVRDRTRRLVGTAGDEYTRAVAEAKYLELLKHDLEENKALLVRMLKQYRPYGREDILEQLPAIYGKTILGDVPVQIVEGADRQRRSPERYRQNPKEFSVTHYTASGEPVRSKNEVIIYDLYWHYGVPVRYEASVILKNAQGRRMEVFPDFTIPAAAGRIIIHEHFGMLESEAGRENYLEKMRLYTNNGYVLWKDLFITVNGPNNSIDAASIDRMIRDYILPQI